MNPSAPSSRELAAEKLRVRAERLRAIRRRIWAGALATFAIAFGVIGVSGSMGSQTTTTLARTSTTSSADDTTGTSTSQDDSTQSSAGTPMTTRQS